MCVSCSKTKVRLLCKSSGKVGEVKIEGSNACVEERNNKSSG